MMDSGLQLRVNGELRHYAAAEFPSTVLALIESLDLDGNMVVAERNGDIVSRKNFADCPLASGDTVELVRFVGGG